MSNRAIFGFNGTTFCCRISRPGVDVLTATSLADFYLHEDYFNHQILVKGSGIIAANAASATITYPNFGFVPIIITSTSHADDTNSWPYMPAGGAMGPYQIIQAPTATSCVLTRNTVTSTPLYFRYMILPLVN